MTSLIVRKSILVCDVEILGFHCMYNKNGLYSEVGDILCPAVNLMYLIKKYLHINLLNFEQGRSSRCQFKDFNVVILFSEKACQTHLR